MIPSAGQKTHANSKLPAFSPIRLWPRQSSVFSHYTNQGKTWSNSFGPKKTIWKAEEEPGKLGKHRMPEPSTRGPVNDICIFAILCKIRVT